MNEAQACLNAMGETQESEFLLIRVFEMNLLINIIFQFQFLLRQVFADDEASTRLLQILLFLLLSTTSLMFIPCTVRSSFTLSIHFFGCLPLLLVPSTCPYSATTGSDIIFT